MRGDHGRLTQPGRFWYVRELQFLAVASSLGGDLGERKHWILTRSKLGRRQADDELIIEENSGVTA